MRSLALGSELNVLSNAAAVAYKLRCDLFRQCSGLSGSAIHANIAAAFESSKNMQKYNRKNMNIGSPLLSELNEFHVDRKLSGSLI